MIRAIAICVLSVCACGCGTVLNLVSYEDTPSIHSRGQVTAPNEIYGGVAIDAASGSEWINQGNPLLGLYVWGVDLPLTIVGDTLTLPLTMGPKIGNPFPKNQTTTQAISSFGKNVKDKSVGLVQSLPSFSEIKDAAYEPEESESDFEY